MIRKLLLLNFLCLFFQFGFSQNLTKMNVWQDSLVKLTEQRFGSVSEAERIESNFQFVKALVSSLKETNAFNFKFEKLKAISILNAPDNSFRVFSWNIPLDDGSFLYYGAIQYKSASLKLTPLLDKTFEIKDVDREILKSSSWFGAQYYDIIQLSPKQFVLLGWKGHHADFNKKVIEVLNIESNNEITFGAKIFSDKIDHSRRVFSYTRKASMYLKYNPEQKRIEFDNIVPVDPSLEGNFKYYGPDLSYDAYVLDANVLKFKENIDVQNITRGDEDNYIDPRKPNKKLKSGLK